MAYRERPAPGPPGLVECCWTAVAPAAGGPHEHAVLPDGCMDLVWTGDVVLVAGPDTAPHPVLRRPGVATAGLRFAPGQLSALLGVPAVALRDRRVPLAELLPGPHRHRARTAAGRLAAGADPAAALAALARSLPGAVPERSVAAVAAHLSAGSSAAATADALGWTTRSLHRRCLDAFGYGPSVLGRVLRFRRAAALLHAGHSPADVAARTGYADQPHLSREVRALAGVAPGQLGSGAKRSMPVPSGSWTTA